MPISEKTTKRGFASMSAEKQREIASKGGKAAHAKGTAHEFTSQEAREAGRKGGHR
jgi:general stress protein YciG